MLSKQSPPLLGRLFPWEQPSHNTALWGRSVKTHVSANSGAKDDLAKSRWAKEENLFDYLFFHSRPFLSGSAST